MEFREKRSLKLAVNIAPLVDVLFMLLIFFIVTSTFIEDQPNIKLELPTTQHAEVGKTEQLALTISREGKLYLQNEPVERNQLEAKLTSVFARREDKSLVLKADKLAPYGIVIDVMDAAKGVGLKKIVASTVREQKD